MQGDTGTDEGGSWAFALSLLASARVDAKHAARDIKVYGQSAALRRSWDVRGFSFADLQERRNLAVARCYRLLRACRSWESPLRVLVLAERSLAKLAFDAEWQAL